MKASAGKVLMVVENLPVPFDRRVWMESTTLRQAGYQVTVICPVGRTGKYYDNIDGIAIYRYPLPSLPGFIGHIVEYGIAVPVTIALSMWVLLRRGFDVIHVANPPDLFFVMSWLYRPFGKKFVFDHHDLVPETCETRWTGTTLTVMRTILTWCERATYAAADLVVATNESYKRVALARGGKRDEDVVVVRSGPLTTKFQPVAPDPALRRGRPFLACYLGVMGPNDGLDLLLQVVRHVVHTRKVTDVSFVLMGTGDCFDDLVKQAETLGVVDYVTFTGRIPDAEVIAHLSTADIGLAPDPKDALNDVSTMNKIIEYMAVGLPVLAFDLIEARVSAGDAADYASNNDPLDMADRLIALLHDRERRDRMRAIGSERVRSTLAWEHQAPKLVGAYRRLIDQP
jgi:glycosyltransferase involved in cell wall biosynthesis